MVGDWTISAKPANATMPIWVVPLCRWTNDEAAASAAMSRLGGMSVEHMLRETSIARITVVRPAGTDTIATGRAIAMTRLPSPMRNSANGRCRRMRDDCGAASRTSDRLEKRTADFGRREAQIRAPTRMRQDDEERQQAGPQEAHGIRPNQRSELAPPMTSRRNPALAKSGVNSNGSVRTTRWLPTSP